MRARLGSLPGVTAYTVDLENDSATVTYDPRRITPDAIGAALAAGGFPVGEIIPLQ